MLIGVCEIPLGRVAGEPLAANASLGHVMAPFGYSLALNLFAKTGRYAGFAELRANVSEGLVLPGLAAELVRYRLPWLQARASRPARACGSRPAAPALRRKNRHARRRARSSPEPAASAQARTLRRARREDARLRSEGTSSSTAA